MHRLLLGRPLISLRNVTFRLGDELVFQNTNWVLRQNEHWAIVGPNGSGKSLLADGLRGRLPAVAGELQYHYRPPANLLREQAIGYVSFEQRKADLGAVVAQSRWNSIEQDASLTVNDLLSYPRVMDVNPFEVEPASAERRRLNFERRKRRAIELLRIGNFLDRPFITLSNGETQRVELAKALCRPMRFLILDEPYAGLDRQMRAHVRSLLQHLMKSALRIVLIGTNTEELPSGVNRVALVRGCAVHSVTPRSPRVLAPPQRPRATSVRLMPLAGHFAPRRSSRIQAGADLVKMRNVTVRYDKAVLLNNVSWSIRAGENWALLGPNGSGKTTLLSLILGDHPQAYSNDISVLGKRRGTGESIWELKQQIGWLSPDLQLHFDFSISCFEAVASGFHETTGLYGPLTRGQQRAVRTCLELFGLDSSANLPLVELSPGLQRMVFLARALAKQPVLLLLDEPCQGLDPMHRQQVVSCVDTLLRRHQTTVVISTHRTEDIPPSITRVLRLKQGRVTEEEDCAAPSKQRE